MDGYDVKCKYDHYLDDFMAENPDARVMMIQKEFNGETRN